MITEQPANVIELAVPHPEGGWAPEARQVMSPVTVTGWRVRIGHTASLADPSAPIVVREADDIAPRGDGQVPYAEGRCPRCIAHATICPGDDETVLILEHKPGCPVLRQILAEVPS